MLQPYNLINTPHILSFFFMKFIYTLIALALFAVQLHAQQTYTEKLRQNEAGKGTVIINQSPEIEQVVNGKAQQKSETKGRITTLPAIGGKPVVTGTSTKSNNTAPTSHTSTSHSTATNATNKSEKAKSATSNVSHGGSSTQSHTYVNRARHKARGYRICIFTGGNSRADKQKAIEMGNKCRAKFPELASYPSFEAPRWVTHVGDFKTREDASKYVSKIRRTRITYEVRIVASEVNIPY